MKTAQNTTSLKTIKGLILLYNFGFSAAMPFLRKNKRLKNGLNQRLGYVLPGKSDVWIQAASGGEAYLALEILRGLAAESLRVLVTTNTDQGLEILTKGITELPAGSQIQVAAQYCPFDKPAVMDKVMDAVQPKLVVLLETELWPGMLWAAKQRKIPVLLANGRISYKSLRGYNYAKSLFAALGPGRIMAISDRDAARFGKIFTNSNISVMPNIKFDRINIAEPCKNGILESFIGTSPFVVLGSVRKEEEADVCALVTGLFKDNPGIIIGLCPRHMERVPFWREALAAAGIKYTLRSQLNRPLQPGSVLLGDTFGELGQAYRAATAVFVGGSLAPLGGQNFLEPLAAGVVPVIGLSWHNFAWVGERIVTDGLVQIAPDAVGVLKALDAYLKQPADKNEIKKRFNAYISANLGGVQMVCDTIKSVLDLRA